MDASKYTINFNNGRAYAVQLPMGSYKFESTTIPGYHTCTATDFEVTPETTYVRIKIHSDGKLTVNVTDENNQPIMSGLLQLCNSDGSESYGLPVKITNGTAVFNYVPHSPFGNIEFYVKQLSSDERHTPIAAPVKVVMNETEKTLHIINDAKEMSVNFSVRDAYYPGILPANGSITFTH